MSISLGNRTILALAVAGLTVAAVAQDNPSVSVSAHAPRAGRDDGRGLCRQELEAAAHLVGPPELRRRLEHRRLPRRAGDSAANPREPHVADTRGIREARAGDRERPRLLGQRGHVPAPRVRPSHVRLHVDDRRPAERPAARADAGRRSRRGRANARHVRARAVRRFRRLLAVRPLHHARRDRLDAARSSTATASASRRTRSPWRSATR